MPVFKLPKGQRLPRPEVFESETGYADGRVMEWFDSVKTAFAETRSEWTDVNASTSTDRLKSLFRRIFPDDIWARMRFVGRGTTRIAFILDSNVCFKFQYNDWKDQSKQEIAEALAWPDLKCFPKLFDWSEDGLCMAYEVAEQPTEYDFAWTFRQGPVWIADKLKEYAETGESRMLDMMLGSGMLNPEQKETFLDLMKFQKEMFANQGKILEDIDHVDNWGKLYRGGQPVLLVTDFGV